MHGLNVDALHPGASILHDPSNQVTPGVDVVRHRVGRPAQTRSGSGLTLCWFDGALCWFDGALCWLDGALCWLGPTLT
jgi:hypothetical protein